MYCIPVVNDLRQNLTLLFHIRWRGYEDPENNCGSSHVPSAILHRLAPFFCAQILLPPLRWWSSSASNPFAGGLRLRSTCCDLPTRARASRYNHEQNGNSRRQVRGSRLG